MLFEISTALSYVLPKKRQFYIGFIGLLASLSIAAIVWVILVFFSVTASFEERWSQKIELLLGPVRITPSAQYLGLPENEVDLLSSESGNSLRRLSLLEQDAFLWDPAVDPHMPAEFSSPYSAIQSGVTDRVFIALKKALEAKKALVSFCETAVRQVTLFPKPKNGTSSVSHYVYILGRNRFFLPKNDIWTKGSVLQYLALLSTVTNEKTVLGLMKLYEAFPFSMTCSNAGSTITARIAPQGVRTEGDDIISFPAFLQTYEIDAISPQSASSDVSLQPVPLEYIPGIGYPIYLPQQMERRGIQFLDHGVVHDSIPLIVFGFFDTGVLPVGGKVCVTSSKLITSLERALPKLHDEFSSSSLLVYPSYNAPYDMRTALQITRSAISDLPPEMHPSFHVETYEEYPETKELYTQLRSERNLFHLIAIVLLAAASINIFSMLFILVYVKTKEIAIMRAIGATRRSIRIIFILSGALLGLTGSFVGILLAQGILILLPEIMRGLNILQGNEVLHSAIYGQMERTLLHVPTLLFCLCITSMTCSLAGWLASFKAIRIHISDALRTG